MVPFVDVYAQTLAVLDPATAALFTVVRERILHSAAALLGHTEVVALRRALSPTAATSSTDVCDAERAAVSSATAAVTLYMGDGLPASLLSGAAASGDGVTAASAPDRLLSDLRRVRQATTAGTSSSSSPPPQSPSPTTTTTAALVLTQLSPACQGLLLLSALWLSTKLWATLTDSTTLYGLASTFLRLAREGQRGHHVDPTVAGAGPDTMRAPHPTRRTGAEALCFTSTPPATPTAPSRERDGQAPAVAHPVGDDDGDCLTSQLVVGDGDVLQCGALTHLLWDDGGLDDEATQLALDVENAEMILLRCSGYTIPV
ncbi:hypothetical protein NESM_000311700 [Novymonas esmeraldas]|uniref:Uncharacterized protein n=1 Tax=Novymonas esmeraldas TaxID=1808958 RepID=A0AAW0EJR9_9TRYP